MPTVADIANCPVNRRPYYLGAAFKLGGSPFACVLTAYLIHDYKATPNKRRAIFIYDECLYSPPRSPFDMDMDKMDLHAMENVDVSGVSGTIDAARAQRAAALKMSWFKRVTSSSGRAVPANLFDGILAEFLKAEGKDNIWKDVMARIDSGAIGSQDVYAVMVRNLPRLKTDLTAADFNLSNVGISTLNPVTAS